MPPLRVRMTFNMWAEICQQGWWEAQLVPRSPRPRAAACRRRGRDSHVIPGCQGAGPREGYAPKRAGGGDSVIRWRPAEECEALRRSQVARRYLPLPA